VHHWRVRKEKGDAGKEELGGLRGGGLGERRGRWKKKNVRAGKLVAYKNGRTRSEE